MSSWSYGHILRLHSPRLTQYGELYAVSLKCCQSSELSSRVSKVCKYWPIDLPASNKEDHVDHSVQELDLLLHV